MRLSYRPAVPQDFTEFYFSCYPKDRENHNLRTIVEREWHFLISKPATFTLVIEDLDRHLGQRIVACAQTVFVNRAFASSVREGLPPWLNVHLTTPDSNGQVPLLDIDQVRFANSGEGLIGVMTRWMIASECYNGAQALRLHSYLLEWFTVFMRGYNLQEVFVESIGPTAYQDAIRAGFKVLNDYHLYYGDDVPPPHSKPCLLHLNKEEAWSSRGSLATWIFVYSAPEFVFDFNLRQQNVLRWALAGNTDPEIADRLDLSIHSINKVWQKIYEVVEGKAIGLLPEPTREQSRRGKRGHEKRRVLLGYLKEHPEELCPIDQDEIRKHKALNREFMRGKLV